MISSKIFIFFLSITYISFQQKGVFIGGALNDSNAEIYNKFIQLSSQTSTPYIGIITAASDTPEEASQGYIDVIQKIYKFKNVEWIPITLKTKQNAYDQKIVDKISKMTGIYFGGGDQTRLIECFYQSDQAKRIDTPALKIIRENYLKNFLTVAGSSAGTTIQQSFQMVTGGESYEAFVYGSHESIDDKHPDDLSYDKYGGFGFFPFGFLDTHYSCRGRQGRMMRLIWDLNMKSNANKIGYGVDENTALIVDGNQAQVIGENGVFIIDMQAAQKLSDQYFSLDKIQVHYLTQEDQIDLKTGEIKFASWKQDIRGKEEYDYPKQPSGDIFSSVKNQEDYMIGTLQRRNPQEFQVVAQDLFNSRKGDSTRGYTYETKPEFRVDLIKDFSRNSYGVVGNKGKTKFISFKNLYLKFGSYKNIEGNLRKSDYQQQFRE